MLASCSLMSLGFTRAHITMNPNFGASAGNYFMTSIRVPHGIVDKETTKVTVHIPFGILSVAPEDKAGWDIAIEYREIEPYINHGVVVNTAPAAVTFSATCTGDNAPLACDNEDHAGLHSDQLIEFSLQTKIGCGFGYDALNSAGTEDATQWMVRPDNCP